MPTIKTKNGNIKYKAKHLYVGVKQINKELAFENLKLLKSIFDQNGLKFVLTYHIAKTVPKKLGQSNKNRPQCLKIGIYKY